MTFMPMAEPKSCASGLFLHLTSTTHVAFLPSSVRSPNSGTKPATEPISSMIPELRLQRAPSTEFAYTTAEDSAQLRTSPFWGLLPTWSR